MLIIWKLPKNYKQMYFPPEKTKIILDIAPDFL